MVFRMTTVGKFFTQSFLKLAEKAHIVPQGTHDVGEALKVAADALVAGGQAKLFTVSCLLIAVPGYILIRCLRQADDAIQYVHN